MKERTALVVARLRDLAHGMRNRAWAATKGPWLAHCEIDGVYAGCTSVVLAGHLRVVTVGQTRQHHTSDGVHIANVANIVHNASPDFVLSIAALLEGYAATLENLAVMDCMTHSPECLHLTGTAHYQPYCNCGAHEPMTLLRNTIATAEKLLAEVPRA